MKLITSCLFLLYCATYSSCIGNHNVRLIVEYVNKTCNPKYATNCTISIKKQKEASYAFNAESYHLHPWGRNITVTFKAYEIHGKQNRGKIMDLTKNVCSINDEVWLMSLMRKYASFVGDCPIKVGVSYVKDLVLDPDFISKFLRIGKYQLYVGYIKTKTKEVMLEMNIYSKVERVVKVAKKG